MPNRRKVLIGLGTSVAVAGCSGASETEPEPENESEPDNVGNENESEPQEPVEEAKAVFEITEAVDGKTFSGDEETYINVTITNTGNAKGEQTIESVSQNKSSTESIELEPGESREITVETINPSKIESGTYEYTVRTDNNEINSKYTSKNLFEQSLAKAKEKYRLALREYGKSTDVEDGTLIHVFPSTEIEAHDAWDYLDEAENEAENILWEDTRDLATTGKQEQKVREYRSYERFIKDLQSIQANIHRAYSAFGPIESKDSYDRSKLEDARKEHNELAKEVEENEMYMEELETKFNQLEWQIEQVATTYDGLANLEGATNPSLLTPTQLQVAIGDFESVIEELEDESSAPPEDMTDEEFLEQVRKFHETTDEALNDITQGSDN